MSCTQIPKEWEDFLSSIPSQWKAQILAFLLKIKNEVALQNCNDAKQWETVTKLSDFQIDGTSVCIVFTNEQGVDTKRCFDIHDVLNDSLYNVDPKCIATVEEWRNMSFEEKMQAIVNKICSLYLME